MKVPLPSVAQNGRLAYPLFGEVTDDRPQHIDVTRVKWIPPYGFYEAQAGAARRLLRRYGYEPGQALFGGWWGRPVGKTPTSRLMMALLALRFNRRFQLDTLPMCLLVAAIVIELHSAEASC